MRRLERPLLCLAILIVGVLIVREIASDATPVAGPSPHVQPERRPTTPVEGTIARPLLG
jgi:hypothetical protein